MSSKSCKYILILVNLDFNYFIIMLKKIFLLIFTSIFLVSCFGSDSEEVINNIEWLSLQQESDFSIGIPENWQVIDNTESILPKPNKWVIELAVASTILKNGFKNNLLILSDNLKSITSSKDFSMLNNVGASRDYIDYNLLNSKNIIFTDWDEGVLYIFEAKYNLDTMKLKFLQTAHICNNYKGFLLTIAIPPSIKDTSNYEQLLKTFSCWSK